MKTSETLKDETAMKINIIIIVYITNDCLLWKAEHVYVEINIKIRLMLLQVNVKQHLLPSDLFCPHIINFFFPQSADRHTFTADISHHQTSGLNPFCSLLGSFVLQQQPLWSCLTCVFLFVSVCVTFLGKFYQSLKDNNVNFHNTDIEKALVKTCKDAKGKENRFVSKRPIGEVVVCYWTLHV